MNDLKFIYSGSFDPVTIGHADIIKRASALCGNLTVAVLSNTTKQPMFSVEDRIEMLTEVCAGMKNIEIMSFDGLYKELIKETHADVIVRGVRNLDDFEYGMQSCAYFNNFIPGCETILIPSRPEYLYVSSTLVREHLLLGGSVEGLVPDCIRDIVENSNFEMEGK